jgi:hypothetical protein
MVRREAMRILPPRGRRVCIAYSTGLPERAKGWPDRLERTDIGVGVYIREKCE